MIRQVFVVSARGGKYQGTPHDSQTPYLTSFLGLPGVTDVSFIYTERGCSAPRTRGDRRRVSPEPGLTAKETGVLAFACSKSLLRTCRTSTLRSS